MYCSKDASLNPAMNEVVSILKRLTSDKTLREAFNAIRPEQDPGEDGNALDETCPIAWYSGNKIRGRLGNTPESNYLPDDGTSFSDSRILNNF